MKTGQRRLIILDKGGLARVNIGWDVSNINMKTGINNNNNTRQGRAGLGEYRVGVRAEYIKY